jgi:Electron transfer flavoprotein, beta subunit
MGADRAILIKHDEEIEPLTVAKALHEIVEQEQPGLIMMGKQAIDDDCSQTGQILAQLCSIPQATFVSQVSIEGDKASVVREIDQGLETLEVDLPAIITTDLRLNEPRYVKLPDIMKAKKKALDVIESSEMKTDFTSAIEVINVSPPPPRESGVMVEDVNELFAALKEKGLVS